MKKNEGILDRGIRLALGLVFAVLAFFVGALWLKVIFGVLAAVSIFTGLAGFCLLYLPFGIDTNDKSDIEHSADGLPHGSH